MCVLLIYIEREREGEKERKETDDKELAHVILEAGKSQDLLYIS